MKVHDWNKLSDRRKQEISKRKAVFIAGSRELSPKRIAQLYKGLAKTGDLVWGVLKDEYIPGFAGSPQFKSLKLSDLPAGDYDVINYYQRDQEYLFAELDFKAVILVNGSWERMLHLRSDYWVLERKRVPSKRVSPFSSEAEAKAYPILIKDELEELLKFDAEKTYSAAELLELAGRVGKASFEWTFQTGAILSRQGKVLAVSYNRIMPYETYALHHGSSKEQHFSPPNDQNHYDTNHAELELLIQALHRQISLKGCDLTINLLPCPACARALARTELKRIYYHLDHSEGYGFKLLTEAGKELIRI
jgi:deoxycytidylate deaminase